jgi:alkylation response protein AidB-like acyl-CoA dehydrogenase
VREFTQKEVAPHIKEWDEKQQFDPSVLKKMAALNLLGVCIPEEYGGAGFDYISLGWCARNSNPSTNSFGSLCRCITARIN